MPEAKTVSKRSSMRDSEGRLVAYVDPSNAEKIGRRSFAAFMAEITGEGDQLEGDVKVVRSGDEITLPEGMEISTAIKWLERKHDSEMMKVAVFEVLEGIHPGDGAIALAKALRNLYGWVTNESTPTMFGPIPPAMISVATGPGTKDVMQTPWGRFSVPNITGHLEPTTNPRSTYPVFAIAGEVLNKDMPKVKAIFDEVRRIVRDESVYRSKAIRIDFAWVREGKAFDMTRHAPKFIDVASSDRNNLVLPRKTERLVEVNLFSFLERKEQMREARIPLKRGVLLFGPYGTGKTLAANVAANIATRNGWTFIYLSDVQDLAQALRFAKQYQPAVVFAEDIDRDVTGDRTTEMDDVLNTIDGIELKGAEIFTVLTSNDATKINPAMLRPGRLDAVIEIPAHDAESALRLVGLYGAEYLDAQSDLTKVGEALAGMIPASIREVVERSKAAAVIDLGSAKIQGHVNADHLLVSAESMREHMNLLRANAAAGKKEDPFARIGNAAGLAIAEAVIHAQENAKGLGVDCPSSPATDEYNDKYQAARDEVDAHA